MNKRAISEHGILTIIFSVLAVIAILITLPIVSRLIFGGEGGTARTAEVNLDSLGNAVNSIVANRQNTVAIRHFTLFIEQGGYAITAFNAKDTKSWNFCNDERMTRPQNCLADKSCLCLYKDTVRADFDSDITTNPPIKCILFPDNLVFLAPSSLDDELTENRLAGWNLGSIMPQNSAESINEINSGSDLIPYAQGYSYENLLLYGECSSQNVRWNQKQVYIEKMVKEGRIYIFIAKESPDTQARFDKMNEWLKSQQVAPSSIS